MDAVMWLFVFLVNGTIFALACAHVAGGKGKDPGTWAFIGFLLGVIGLLIIGLSEKDSNSENSGLKRCSQCAEDVKFEAKICRFCGYTFGDIKEEGLDWANGTYKGDLLYGKPHGYGVWNSDTGMKYEGNWIDGKKHGRGELTLEDGQKFKDVWLDDQRSYKTIE